METYRLTEASQAQPPAEWAIEWDAKSVIETEGMPKILRTANLIYERNQAFDYRMTSEGLNGACWEMIFKAAESTEARLRVWIKDGISPYDLGVFQVGDLPKLGKAEKELSFRKLD